MEDRVMSTRIFYKDDSDNWKELNPYYVDINEVQKIDQYGEFSFNYPTLDSKSQFLTDRREIIIQHGAKSFGGKITKAQKEESSSGPVITVSGVELTEDFCNDVTLPNILFNNADYVDILDPANPNTIIKPTNWDTEVESTGDALTYLSSLQTSLSMFNILARQGGFHFRYIGDITTPRKIEFGTFSSSSGIKIRKTPNSIRDADLPSDILSIDTNGLTKIEDSLSVVNWVYPTGGGGGNGANQLTLRDVDPSVIDPDYPIYIDTGTPNTETTYDPTVFDNTKSAPNTYQTFYLKNQDSIDKFGGVPIKRAINFYDIYPARDPATNQVTDLQRTRAANELYKGTVQYLKNNKDKTQTYQVKCFGKNDEFRVGDLINLKFKGLIKKLNEDSTTSTIYEDIDQDFYVTEIRASLVPDGVRLYNLQLRTVNQFLNEDIDVLASAVESISNSQNQRKGSVTTYPVYFEDSFDNLFPAEFSYWIPPEFVYSNYLKLKVRIKKFRAYSKATQGGGATTQTTSAGGATTQTTVSAGTHNHTVSIPSHTHTVLYGLASVGPPAAFTLCGIGGSGGTQILVGSVGAGFSGAQSSGSGGATVPTSSSAGLHSHSVSIPNHTHNVTLPNHTHAITFGIYEDNTPPTDVKIYIDGVDYSSQLGTYSAFGDYPSATDENFDLLEAAAALGKYDDLLEPGIHTISVQCASGRGKVQLFLYNQFYLSNI